MLTLKLPQEGFGTFLDQDVRKKYSGMWNQSKKHGEGKSVTVSGPLKGTIEYANYRRGVVHGLMLISYPKDQVPIPSYKKKLKKFKEPPVKMDTYCFEFSHGQMIRPIYKDHKSADIVEIKSMV